MSDPIAGSLVVLDLIPVMVFEIEFDGKIRAFEENEVSDVVTNLQPSSILQVSSRDVTVPSSSDWHSGLEIFAQCHDGEVRPNVTTRQVVLLNLSLFCGSAKREVSVLIRSGLRYEVLSTYMSQRRLVRSRLKSEVKEVDQRYNSTRQEVELRVLPLLTRRFKYIIEVALKLLFELRNPMTTILGMTPYVAIVQ